MKTTFLSDSIGLRKIAAAILSASVYAGNIAADVCVTSPDGRISVESSGEGLSLVCESNAGASLRMLQLQCGPVRTITESDPVDVEYDMVAGKRKHCVNSYREGGICFLTATPSA